MRISKLLGNATLWPVLVSLFFVAVHGQIAAGQSPATWAQPPAQAHPGPIRAIRYIEKEMLVPVANAMPRGLDVLLDVLEMYADTPGRHPLAVLTHGTSIKPEERMRVTPWAQYNQGLWFVRRGYVVLVVVRKGYGRSSGQQDTRSGGCGSQGSFHDAGEASAEDLIGVIHWALSQPEVDPNTVISIGVSTGGFAQVALAANPPKELKAVINFAGGRGSDGKEHNCDLDSLLHAFQSFGKDAAKHGATPMLAIYSENDHYFPPAMAAKFDEAYRKGEGTNPAYQFVMAPPDGEDGHHLYSHPDAWSATVTAFLKANNLLPLGDVVLPLPPVPDVPAPPGLRDRGLDAWKRFLAAAPYKAFATTGTGMWGQAGGQFDQELANQDALDRCRKAAGASANACRVVAQTQAAK